jgi:hypothetical protein
MIQLDLFNGIRNDDFLQYHRDNPHIYEAFRRITIRAIQRGYRHWGAKGAFEVLRWETGVAGNDEYKVNNNYTPLYARMFANEYPEHAGFFRVRESKFDTVFV